MAKFISKPTEIEAEQFTGPGSHPEVVEYPACSPPYMVRGKQGHVPVNVGDWIIAEADGSGFYPCAPDIFERKYAPKD